MNVRFKKASLAIAMAFAMGMPLLHGCAISESDPRVMAAVEDKPFYGWFNGLTSQIKADSKYKRIPLDTEAQQDEFLVWLHDAYRHRITRQEFADRVNAQYPGHDYETSFIVSRLP